MKKRFFGLLLAVPFLSGCVEQSDVSSALSVRSVGFEALTGWQQEDFGSLLPLMRQNCRRLAQLPPETVLGGNASLPYGRHVGDWSGACEAAQGALDARTYFQTWFQPYQVDAAAFYTGYFEPQFPASLTRGGVYQTPLYGRPHDLARARSASGELINGLWEDGQFRPYYDRAAIDEGALKGQGLEIAWLKSPIDLFFLQIQGSGRLVLPDGSQIRVSYDGKNGQPYVPLGKVLVRENELAASDVSMDSIRGWLEAHPDRMMAMMERNPDYVFFHRDESDLGHGAKGAFGISLTAGRSVAIDRRVVPFGMPLWVETRLPDAKGQGAEWRHLVFAQDIGTNIRGAGRADLFTGWGAMAQYVAGRLHEGGTMTLLLPRPPA